MALDLAMVQQMIDIRAQASTQHEEDTEDGPRTVLVKERPVTKAYHLKYDAEGNIIDWHVDVFRLDVNGLVNKLSRRYGKNMPGFGQSIWVLALPESAKRPERSTPCAHPACPMMFANAVDMNQHLRVHHREYFRLQQETEERMQKDRQLELMQQQLDQQALLIEQLRSGQKKGV